MMVKNLTYFNTIWKKYKLFDKKMLYIHIWTDVFNLLTFDVPTQTQVEKKFFLYVQKKSISPLA